MANSITSDQKLLIKKRIFRNKTKKTFYSIINIINKIS